MVSLSCKDQGLDCEFRAEAETPSLCVSKYIAHGIETHPEYLGKLRETMTEDDIRAMLMEQADPA